ncbi:MULTISPECIES: hypothetical protein [Pseudomonas]|jgi:hypothetical protein|uniref:hypothetical protein n=1 Tax=Pseudomonas TaxID=286 RepID=UPI00059E9626|nr:MULTISPECIES: hypothetical protein [Pseudomonas]AMT89030.1 hypothetical protein AYO71_16330 [Pseudomonas koreensis]MBB4054100.1 hypothetical protein [Pseudomonas koreensis]TSB53050.1 hypothetical protein FEE99_04530 [Pseudomonas sp. ef1]
MEIIVDLHGTDETEQDARDKTIKNRTVAGKILVITKVQMRPASHSATVTYEYETDPNFDWEEKTAEY